MRDIRAHLKKKYVKKLNVVQGFLFTELELENLVDKKLPIDLKGLEFLAENIHNKYPVLDKHEIMLIIKMFFCRIRKFLITKKVINFSDFIFDTKLHFMMNCRNKNIIRVKIKLRTPENIKNV